MDFLYYFLLLCSPLWAWKINLKAPAIYNSEGDYTQFLYELSDPSPLDLQDAVIAIPSCKEIKLVNIPKDEFSVVNWHGVSVKGIKWTALKVSGSKLNVKVSGNIKSGQNDYFITTSSGKTSHKVSGPICETIPVLKCDAGAKQTATCGGRVVLSAQGSKAATKYVWQTAEPGVVIKNGETAVPTVVFPVMCSHSVVITLTVSGHGQTAMCNTYVDVADLIKPKLVGLYAVDLEVDCDDIPAPSLITATDNCGDAPEVSYSEKIGDPTNGVSIITRTWSTEDHCGLKTSHVQTISVRDSVAPKLVGVPEDETHSCHVVPAPCEVLAYDNCDSSVSVSETQIKLSGSCDDSFKIIRTWTAVDKAGQSSSGVQTVQIVDKDPPRLVGVPEDVSIHCGKLPDVPVVTAIDNCASSLTVTVTETHIDRVSPPSPYHYTMLRVFSASDKCGNIGVHPWTIEINDNEAPAISGVEPDKTVNCAEVPPPCEISVLDNCDASASFVLVETTVKGSCSNAYTIRRVWTAVDGNGNAAEETQMIHVVDVTKPKWLKSIAPEIFASCDFVPVVELDADDDCGKATVTKHTEVINGSSLFHYTLIHTWVATDECGLTDTKVQTIHVEDSVPPTMSGLPAPFVNESCTSSINDPLVVATDNCPGCNVALKMVQVTTAGTCKQEYTLERTWTATDCGGHTVDYVQTINIKDTEAPKLIGLVGHLIVPVGNVPKAAVVTATDNCDKDVPVTFKEKNVPGTCEFEYSLIREWKAVDDCGNVATHTQTIDVVDNEAPVFNKILDNIAVSCNNIPQSSLNATDNSGAAISITLKQKVVSGTCPDSYTLVRTFTASDVCGNVVTQEQSIVVHDLEPPVILEGEDYESTLVLNKFLAPEDKAATDLCDPNVVVEGHTETIASSCPSEYSVVYNWTAADRCGNVAEPLVQTIILHDETKPIFNVKEENVTVPCDAIPPPITPVATDSDGTLTPVKYSETKIIGSCSNRFDLLRTWRTQDCVGNAAKHTYKVTVNDHTGPFLSAPPVDTTVSCGNIPPSNPDAVTASDDCVKILNVMYEEDKVGHTTGQYIMVRSWKVTDGCNDQKSVKQSITVKDDVTPSIKGIPDDVTFDCDSSLPVAPKGSCSDDCDGDSIPIFSEVEVPTAQCINGVYLKIIRTWTCTDSSSNSVSKSQTITMISRDPPAFISPPSNLTISCNGTVPSMPHILTNDCSQAAAIHNPSVLVNSTRKIAGSTVNDYRIIYKWVLTDTCGNTANTEQTITVEDHVAPTLVAPPSETVDCKAQLTRPIIVPVDSCDANPTATANTETIQGTCNDRYTVTHTWGATDLSGNKANPVAMSYTVDDTQVPTFVAPDPVVSISYTELSKYPKLQLHVTDNCDPNPTATCTRSKTAKTCPHEYIIVDTCVVSDRCGNNETVTRTIYANDDIPPQLSGGDIPDTSYECPQKPPPPPQFTSEVGIEVDYKETYISRPCHNSYTIERRWTAEDCVHNQVSATQTIVVQDTTPPVLSPIPPHVTKECDICLANLTDKVTATDSCHSVSVSLKTETITNNLPKDVAKMYIRTWTAVDNCNNSAVGVQTITIVDSEAPKVVNVPDQMDITKSVSPLAVSLSKVHESTVSCHDDCDSSSLTFSQSKIAGKCASNYLVIRRWECTDKMGKSSVEVRTIYVNDESAPVLQNIGPSGTRKLPADVTVEADSVEPIQVLTAKDDVDSVVLVTSSQTKTKGTDDQHYTLFRTWTSKDSCSNSVTHIQTIQVQPCTAPLIPTVPCHTTVECDSIPTATDDVELTNLVKLQVKIPGVKITFKRETMKGSCSGHYKIIRTWEAADLEGNTISDFQSIDVVDTTAPVFTLPLPTEYQTVECDSVHKAEQLSATDNCGAATVVLKANQTKPKNGIYVITRVWIATDDCGNQDSHVSRIEVVDTSAPTFVVKPISVVHNGLPCNYPCEFTPDEAKTIVVKDNCGSASYECKPSWIIEPCISVRRVNCVAVDESGNQATYTYENTYKDTDKPVLSAPPSHTSIDCEDSEPPLSNVTVTEPCGVVYPVSSVSQYIVMNGLDVVIRTWSATDNCGHTSSVVQTITKIDTTPPELYHVPESTTVSCGHSALPSDVSGDDNCGKEVTITSSFIRSDGSCINSYTVVKTWVVTDASGLSTIGTQTIVVVDTTPPVLHGLPSSDHENINAHCNLIPTPPNNVSVVDNCDPLAENTDFTYVQNIVKKNLSKGEEYLLVRTWTALDTCDNSAQFVQTVHVLTDSISPVLSGIPNDFHTNCSGPFDSVDPVVEDNCDEGLSATKTETIEDKVCDNSYNILRTWSVSDSFGNVASYTQTIFVLDDMPPTLYNVPKNVYVSCSEVPSPAQVSSVDQCGQGSTVSLTQDPVPVGKYNYDLVYSWTGTDACGNTVTESQTVVVSDTSAPTFVSVVPSDLTLSCKDAIPVVPKMEVTDNCDPNPKIENKITRKEYECTNHYSIYRQWIASDANGNVKTVTQVITIIDEVPPSFVNFGPNGRPSAEYDAGLLDVTVQCDEPPVVALTAVDNCDSSVLVNVATVPIRFLSQPELINVHERHYSAVDSCGNRADYRFTITVVDKIPPTLSAVPQDISVECSDKNLSLYDKQNILVSDDCSTATVDLQTSITPGSCAQEFTKTYTYTGVDENGNSVQESFVATVFDKTAPVLHNIPQWSSDVFECSNVPSSNETNNVTAVDACEGNVSVKFNRKMSPHEADVFSYFIYFVWSAADNCGNVASRSITVQVNDTIAPTLVCPDQDCADRVVECGGVPHVPKVDAQDNCDFSVVAEFNEVTVPTSCDSAYTLIRSWTAVDNSGNSNTRTQTITVQNSVNPVLYFGPGGLPGSIEVDCQSVPVPPTPVAKHDCENVVAVYKETRTNGTCPSSYSLTRSWKVVSCVGLTFEHVQVITVIDTTKPILSMFPADNTVQIDDIKSSWPGKLSATDNCDGNVPVKFTQKRNAGTCRSEFVLIRQWSAEDLCGNVAVNRQTVHVIDTIPPVLNGIPSETFVEYGDLKDFGEASTKGVTASDNSKAKMAIMVSESKVNGACATVFKLIRKWTATDLCGNTAEESQIINVVDSTPPDINLPDDETVECDAIPVICEVKINSPLDHPDHSLDIKKSEKKIPGAHKYNYRLVRTWSVEDCAGNKASHDQTIHVRDLTPPVFTKKYANETTNCDCETNTELFQVDALDNCDGIVQGIQPEVNIVKGSSADNYQVHRKWSAHDSSGNVAVHIQTVVVQDIKPPDWCDEEELPAKMFFEQCDNVPPVPELKAQDDCDPKVAVTFTEESISGSCKDSFRLKRTWTAIDRSGNSMSHISEIVVSDSLAPTLLNSAEKLCLWPDNGMVAVYEEASQSLIDAVDNCGSVSTSIISCNSTDGSGSKSCAYNPSQDILYVKIAQNSLLGRTYKVSATIKDQCGNTRKNAVKRIWILPSKSKFDEAIELGDCSGTGAHRYISAIPSF